MSTKHGHLQSIHMYRVIVSFYGTLYKHDDRQYIIECIKAEEAFKRLQKEIRKEYGKDADEYKITDMEYLENTKMI
jgi:hypothetical protein